jgi:hypothetical protein
VEDDIDPLDRRRAGVAVADVALDEAEAVAIGPGQLARDFVKVALVARGEIVEADDPLAIGQQRLDQVRPDETGRAGYEPARLALGKARVKVGRKDGFSPIL